MLNQEVLEYVNDVMSRITAPDEFKDSLRNELTRYIVEDLKGTSSEEIVNKLGSAQRLANEISRKLADRMSEDFDSIITKSDKQDIEDTETSEGSQEERGWKKPYGEFSEEESNINIKLLYIPLLQIGSQTQKTHYYLTDDDEEECDEECDEGCDEECDEDCDDKCDEDCDDKCDKKCDDKCEDKCNKKCDDKCDDKKCEDKCDKKCDKK